MRYVSDVATLQLTVSRLFGHTIICMHAITLVVTHQGATCLGLSRTIGVGW